MVIDSLWPDGPKLIRSENVFMLGTDAVLLSHFADCANAGKACDLGCGSGIISILLAWNNKKTFFDGIEIQKNAADIASKNVSLNNMSDRINIICRDIRSCRDIGGAGSYDLVVANPPYFPVESGKHSETESTAIARQERSCTLNDICAAASFFTRWGGKFAMVHKPNRLSEICCCLTSYGLEPKRLRFVQGRYDSLPSLVLIESRRGGKSGLTIEKPLIIYNNDGSETDEIKNIYHR